MQTKESYIGDIKRLLNQDKDQWDWWNRDMVIGNRFLGVWTEKNPNDAWRYQEIILVNKPDIILETGSFKGGSALFLATMMDLVGHGKIISVDNRDNGQLEIVHPRIELRIGSCLDQEYELKDKKVMVILDCDHTEEHVDLELKKYSKYVTEEQYLIVEDTVVHNAIESVEKFLNKTDEFKMVNEPLFTSNHKGYLIKK